MARKDDPLGMLVGLRPKLIEAFQFNHEDLADLMYPEGFLSKSDHEIVTAVRSVISKSEKARIMVESLIKKVEIKCENYQTFLKLVQSHPKKFSNVLDVLDPGKSNIL